MCSLSDLPTEFLLTPEITLVPASTVLRPAENGNQELRLITQMQSELLGQFRLIRDRASDVSGRRICLTQNAYAEL